MPTAAGSSHRVSRWLDNNRRNLPPAAIGDLKLEEKEIVARQAKERMSPGTNQYSKRSTPNLGETKADRHSGETLEILARDIPMGRESLRKDNAGHSSGRGFYARQQVRAL